MLTSSAFKILVKKIKLFSIEYIKYFLNIYFNFKLLPNLILLLYH